MSKEAYDLAVIGSGPAGEVGAIRAAQLGMKVAVIEKNTHLGGTCLNVGCIPTKALLASAKSWTQLQNLSKQGFAVDKPRYDWGKIMARKDNIVNKQRKGLKFLMKKNNITLIQGWASFADQETLRIDHTQGGPSSVKARHILLASGSRVRPLGLAAFNDKTILSSDSILTIPKVPTSLAIIGGGVIGMEFASLFGRFGTRVSVIEEQERILAGEDQECVQAALRAFKKQNISVETGAKLTALSPKEGACTVSVAGSEDRDFDHVLVAIGRLPALTGLGLEQAGIHLDAKGFVRVDAHYRTNAANVFAVGDVIASPGLAHTASAEAKHAVELIAGCQPPLIDYTSNPSAMYAYPEIASIGLQERAIQEQQIAYGTAKFPFAPLAKAKIEEETEGFIKIFYEQRYREILGVHIVGARATELISEFVLGKLLEATIDELGYAIHPHPTISETIMEAAHAAHGAIHI